MTIQGHCDPAFTAVREVFEEHFAAGREDGAGLAIYAGDQLVVDLWGGLADPATGREWEHDTPCPAYSCTKAVTTTAALLLADRGAYELDEPVTRWWPEYGAHGKGRTTAAHLLSHQAGVPAFDRRLSAEQAADSRALAAGLAAQRPVWTPGTDHGYHAMTFGWLIGELVFRLSGAGLGDFVRQEIAGDLDLWMGAPPEVIDRTARMTPDDKGRTSSAGLDLKGVGLSGMRLLRKLGKAVKDQNSLLNRALNNPSMAGLGLNNPVVLAAGWPSAGLVTTAPAFAAFYRDLVAGRILKVDTIRDAIRLRVSGPDRVLLVDSFFGLGYQRIAKTFPRPPAGAGNAFGYAGAGGSVGFGDLDAGIAVAYLPNLMGHTFAGDERAFRLVEAIYSCCRAGGS